MTRRIELHINGEKKGLEIEPERSLLSVLRDALDLTGAKYGCGEGQCGACTVLVDGHPVRSCVTPVGDVSGKNITTIEGLAKKDRLHPVQEAFLASEALQCGYCTTGMIMSAVALLQRNANPGTQEIVRFMEGNVCRCCVYPAIVEAIRNAAKVSRKK